jgi:hypothetical protein
MDVQITTVAGVTGSKVVSTQGGMMSGAERPEEETTNIISIAAYLFTFSCAAEDGRNIVNSTLGLMLKQYLTFLSTNMETCECWVKEPMDKTDI